MANQIAPSSPSDTFVPGVGGTVKYVDSLDPSGPTGTIAVNASTPAAAAGPAKSKEAV